MSTLCIICLTRLNYISRITLISNLVTVIMVFDTSVPIPLRSMCATPNLVLTNIMACRVYRRTRAGIFREVEVSTTALSDKIHKPNIPIAFYTTNTTVTTPAPYPVDIELPRLPMSPASSNSHPSNGSHSNTYEGSFSGSTTTTHEKKNNYPGSFLDIRREE